MPDAKPDDKIAILKQKITEIDEFVENLDDIETLGQAITVSTFRTFGNYVLDIANYVEKLTLEEFEEAKGCLNGEPVSDERPDSMPCPLCEKGTAKKSLVVRYQCDNCRARHYPDDNLKVK